jgi:holo-[acyl-carrier protein] synthase
MHDLARVEERVARIGSACGLDTGLGVDAVCIAEWERHLRAGGERLLRRVYTKQELKFCAGRTERLAARMAAKEAALKALGTGMRGIRLPEVEVVSRPEGLPELVLRGAAALRAEELGWRRWRLSLCREGDLALAIVAAFAGEEGA